MLGSCLLFLSFADIFKIIVFRKFFEEYHQSDKEIYQDQNVGPAQGLNCLQNNICRRQKSSLKSEVDAKKKATVLNIN